MPYGLNPYGGYTGLKIPTDNNLLGAGPAGPGPTPGLQVGPGMANLQATAGDMPSPMFGQSGGGGGSLGPLAGFAMNMFMGEMNKGHSLPPPPQHMMGFRQPQQIPAIAPPSLYHPLAIGRPYG